MCHKNVPRTNSRKIMDISMQIMSRSIIYKGVCIFFNTLIVFIQIIRNVINNCHYCHYFLIIRPGCYPLLIGSEDFVCSAN